jgi:hypothetical protein
MKPRVAMTTTLALIHIGFGLLALPLLHSDRLGAVFVGSIYGPLSAIEHLGLPVFYFKGFYIPELTLLGWIIICLFWLAIYWLVADVLVRVVGKQRRVA